MTQGARMKSASMNTADKIYVAGHAGMVGSALVRGLRARGFNNLLLRDLSELDLTDESAVRSLFQAERPDFVFLAAALVGGIQANIDRPADFLRDNLAIQTNVIHHAWRNGVRKLCFLGSSCIYPRACPQPMREEHLLTGLLEPTNEGYAIAKIAGLKMAEYYRRQHGFPAISVMPCNLYGTNDSFDPLHSHVLSALVRKFVDAADDARESVEVWGTGSARREFMHVDDAAAAMLFLMEHYDEAVHINVGTGVDVTIKELAAMVAAAAGFGGEIRWDSSRPDGMPRKCLDVSRLREMGFEATISLEAGIQQTIDDYRALKAAGSIPQ